MKKMNLAGVVMMGLLLGCATAAPQQAPGTQQQKAASAPASPDDELICQDVPITGSHLPQRVCRTKRQIQREREAAQKALQSPEKVNRRLGE